tara:strand:- start:157 stop:339 length:183 start_codon:yes stop_codon:yes gene_type:complete
MQKRLLLIVDKFLGLAEGDSHHQSTTKVVAVCGDANTSLIIAIHDMPISAVSKSDEKSIE